jgi:hypothetical protein
MARSTFEGPILAGDSRFGPLRNVGSARLSQNVLLDYSAAIAGTAGYAGTAGQFVNGNVLSADANVNAPVFSPSASVYPPVTVTPTADTTTAEYRGAVFYLPAGSQIESIVVDYLTALTVANSTLTSVAILFSNGFVTSAPTYATVTLGTTTVGTAGRQTTTYTAANLANMAATPVDITGLNGSGQPSMSQVVATLAITGTGLGTISAGKFNIDINYVQADGTLGTATVYPYGNAD